MVGTWKRGMGNTKQELMEDFKGHEAGVDGRFQGTRSRSWWKISRDTKQELMEDFKGHEAGIGGRFQGVVGGDWELEAEVWVAGSKKEQRVGTGSLDLIF